jgi:PPM family protein phosphatase
MIAMHAVGFTDVGRQRTANEDGFGSWSTEGLFAVCDGMGGVRGGEEAIRVALESLHEGFCTLLPPGGYRTNAGLRGFERLEAAVQFANRRVFEKSNSSPIYRGIGTTIATISIESDTVFMAHAGDSRIYRYRTQNLEQLTRDHSLLNDYLKFKPDLTAEEIAAIPKNVLTRALGMNTEVKVELHHERAYPGDLYLLCTDGIHGMIDDATIAGIFQADLGLPETSKTLLDAALEAGGADNIAAVLVQFAKE